MWAQGGQEAQKPAEGHDNSEFGLGPNWAREYVEQAAIEQAQGLEIQEVQETANQLLNNAENDPKFAYSKFMKFMRQVGDGEVSIANGEVIGDVADDWSKEYIASASSSGITKSEDPIETTAKAWAEEHTGKMFFVVIFIL